LRHTGEKSAKDEIWPDLFGKYQNGPDWDLEKP
jgi:hypothetical protein